MKNKKASITGTRYVLAVKNLTESAEYYKTSLGFKTWWNGEGWCFLKRDNFFVMLGECKDDKSAFETNNHSYFAYVDMENIDDLYDEYKENKVEIIHEISNKPWSQREFGIRTIDGHRIMFGEEIKTN